MPALATLTINDGQASPAAHSFVAKGTDGALSRFQELSAGTPAGFFTLSHEYVSPTNATAAHRIKLGLNVPVMATVDGVPTVVRNSSAQVIFNLSQYSSDQERKDLIAYVTNALSNATVKSTVVNLEAFW